MTNEFVFLLAAATLAIFLGYGLYQRQQVRKAWKRDEKTDMGLAEERRRNGEIGRGHELRDRPRNQG